MGTQQNPIQFTNNAGGINEAISKYQINNNEASDVLNMYFERFGSYGKVIGRKGRTLINTIAMGGDVKGIFQFNIDGTSYLQCYTNDGKMNSIDLGAGTTAVVESGLDTSLIPDMSVLGGKAFLSQLYNTTVIDNCDAITGWTAEANTTGPTLNTSSKYEGTGSVGFATTNTTVPVPQHGIYKDYTAFDMTEGILSFQFMLQEILTDDYKGVFLRVYLYNEAGETNGEVRFYSTDDYTFDEWNNIVINYSEDPADATYGTFDPTAVVRVKVTLDGAADKKVAGYIDDIRMVKYVGLNKAIDNTGWSPVEDINVPQNVTTTDVFNGRLFVAYENTLYWSSTNDGTDWTTDSSNFGIDDGDGDSIIGIRALSNQLIVFKNYSIHRIKPTNLASVPYRRESVYTGGAKDIGIGCVSKETIKNVVLGTPSDQYFTGVEYLLFASANGLYAIGTTGGPIAIDRRVNHTVRNIPENKRENSFSVVNPEKRQYWFAYPETDGISDNQLVYSMDAKAWSKYDFADITSASSYVDTTKTYILMGDKDGYLYKHDYQTSDSLTDYRDQDGAEDYAAIDMIYESKHNNYGNRGQNVSLIDTIVQYGSETTDMPITMTVTNEDDNTLSETFSTLHASLPISEKVVTTKMYGRYIGHKFRNNIISNTMTLYQYTVYGLPTRSIK